MPVKDHTAFLPLVEEFCTVEGIWPVPVIPSMRLETIQTKDLFSGPCFSVCAVLWGHVSSPMWWEAPAFAAQSCCGDIYFFWLSGKVQILQYSRDDVTSGCCQKAPSVCLFSLHVDFWTLSHLCCGYGLGLSGPKGHLSSAPLCTLCCLLYSHLPALRLPTVDRNSSLPICTASLAESSARLLFELDGSWCFQNWCVATSLPPFQVNFSTCFVALQRPGMIIYK